MGENVVNSAGFAITVEGSTAGWTLCVGLGSAGLHQPSPLMSTTTAAQVHAAARQASDIASAITAARAAMPPAVVVWFDALPTIGGVNTAERIVLAIRADPRPPVPPEVAGSGLTAL